MSVGDGRNARAVRLGLVRLDDANGVDQGLDLGNAEVLTDERQSRPVNAAAAVGEQVVGMHGELQPIAERLQAFGVVLVVESAVVCPVVATSAAGPGVEVAAEFPAVSACAVM